MTRPAHGRPRERSRPRLSHVVGWSVTAVCVLLLAAQALASSSGEDAPARGSPVSAPSPGTGGDRPPTPSPTPTLTAAAASPVTITSPGQRSQVAGKSGVRLSGTAKDLGHGELRFFVYAQDGRYYAAHAKAVPVVRGRWNLTVARIGAGRRDVGSIFLIIATVADPSCQSALRGARADTTGNIAFSRLPSGCTERDSVSVRKTAP